MLRARQKRMRCIGTGRWKDLLMEPFTHSVNRLVFIIFLITTSLVFSQYRDIPDVVTKVATSAGNWLKLETNPRAVGMGGAFVASGRGIGAVSYNPAAIAFVKGQEGYIFRTNYIAGITHNVVSYGRRLSGSDFIGFHFILSGFRPDGRNKPRLSQWDGRTVSCPIHCFQNHLRSPDDRPVKGRNQFKFYP